MPPEQPTTSTLVAIRAEHHAEATPQYDRVVFEFSAPIPLLRIEYVKQLIADGSGLPISIAGGRFCTYTSHLHTLTTTRGKPPHQ
jgi:hypothetical protein